MRRFRSCPISPSASQSECRTLPSVLAPGSEPADPFMHDFTMLPVALLLVALCRAGEVLVKVAAAGVNPVDSAIRGGYFGPATSFPLVLGGDLSGTVVSAGAGSRFVAGDAVFAMTAAVFGSLAPARQGAFAEYAIVAESELARAPTSIPITHAAAPPLVALTALQALAAAAPVPGQRVLINGASGGVGHVAVQLAKSEFGLHVTALSSAKNAAWVRGLGADAVVDYAPGVAAALAPFTGDEAAKFDIIFDVLGGENLDFAATHALKKGGFVTHVQSTGSGGSEVARTDGAGLRFARTLVKPVGEQLSRIAALIDGGKLSVKVAKELPLGPEGVGAALAEVSAGHAGGKVILIV